MKISKIFVLLSSISLIGFLSPVSEVKADEPNIAVQEAYSDQFEVIDVTKEQIISDYAKVYNVSFEEASNVLFPPIPATRSARSTNSEETSYVMLRATQYTTRTQNIPDNAGQVYFYCQVSTSGGFRGIQKIIYAGYNSGNLVFNGQFQYYLPDPNKIPYTLNGGLYSNTTFSVTGGGSVELGGGASMNVSVTGTSNYVKNLYYHGDIGY